MADPTPRLSSGPRERSGAFYIGWEERAPRPIARFVLAVVALLGLLALALPLAFAGLQEPFGDGTFAYGSPEEMVGTVHATPHPRLVTDEGETIYLVALGKHTARPQTAPFDGHRVVAVGTRIERDGTRMLELVDAGLVAASPVTGESPRPTWRSLGQRTLRGEIVDSKCWLGVMKPGDRKVHRACATLCLRGGVPPLFVVRDAEGEVIDELLLVDSTGAALGSASGDPLLEFVAEPVQISGEVVEVDGRLELWADLETSIERVAEDPAPATPR